MNKKEKKHVLALGGLRECHDILIEQGHQITWMINKKSLSPDDTSRPPSMIIIYDDSYSIEDLVALAKNIHRSFPIDVLAAFHDSYQILGYRIAQAIDLPPFASLPEEVIERCFVKDKLRESLENSSLPQVKYKKVNSFQEVVAFIQTSTIKEFIIKPLAGSGSRSICRFSKAKIKEDLKNYDFSSPAIVEEFIGGNEYSVEVVSVNGNHKVIAVTKKYINSETFIEVGHVIPAPLSKDQYNSVHSYIETFLNHIGLLNGLSHTEIKIFDGKIYVIETHTRLGGDRIPLLIENSFGVNFYKVYSNFVSSRSDLPPDNLDDILENYNPNNKVCTAVYFYYPTQSGTIINISGQEKIPLLPGFKKLTIERKIGDKLYPPLHSFDRPAYAIFEGRTADEAVKRAQDAINLLHFELIN